MIPLLDHAEATGETFQTFSRKLGKACRETSFFLLRNHGVEKGRISDVFSLAEDFFDLPFELKQALSIEHSQSNRGYVREGLESLDDTSGVSDTKEAFNIGLDLTADDPAILRGEPFRAINRWPELSGFQEALFSYFDTVLRLSIHLHRAIALDLSLSENFFAPHFDAPMATLHLLHYPQNANDTAIGASAHTDYGSLTLLLTDGTAGLQVKPRGNDWIDVPHIKGAFVVNIGIF